MGNIVFLRGLTRTLIIEAYRPGVLVVQRQNPVMYALAANKIK